MRKGSWECGPRLSEGHCLHRGRPSPTSHLRNQLQLLGKCGQHGRTPAHYDEEAGLVPLRFREGFEAILPMHQHPRGAPHRNPHPRLRSSTSEGIPHGRLLVLPATPPQFQAPSCGCRSRLAVLPPPERNQHPSLCSEERTCSAARLAACVGVPGGARAVRAACSLGRQEVSPRAAIPLGRLQPGRLFYSQG